MTTIDKIRAEIDKRYAEYRAKMKTDDFTYYEGMADALDLFEQFLDTLEEPVSDCHDLEEAAETKYPTRWKKYPNDGIVRSEEYFDLNAEKREAFITGAEWQKAKMMEGATYNELMELYRAIRDELVKRHRDVPVNIKEEL